MESILKKLILELGGNTPKLALKEMLNGFEGFPAESTGEVERYMENYIINIVQSLEDLTIDDDESEALASLPTIWLEMRLEWNRYNNQMQYQVIVKGKSNPVLMAKGAILSYMIGIVEKNLHHEDVYWIQKLASGALDAIRNRIQLNQKYLDAIDTSKDSSSIYKDLLSKIQKDFNSDMPDKKRELNALIDEANSKINNTHLISVKDLHENFELIVAEHLKKSPLTLVLSTDSLDEDIKIPFLSISQLRNNFDIWIKEIIKNQNKESQKTHYSLSWGLVAINDRLKLTLKDDSKREEIKFLNALSSTDTQDKVSGINVLEISF